MKCKTSLNLLSFGVHCPWTLRDVSANKVLQTAMNSLVIIMLITKFLVMLYTVSILHDQLSWVSWYTNRNWEFYFSIYGYFPIFRESILSLNVFIQFEQNHLFVSVKYQIKDEWKMKVKVCVIDGEYLEYLPSFLY